VPWGSHFCANCGRPVGGEAVIACRGCGHPLPADAGFCASCGRPAELDGDTDSGAVPAKVVDETIAHGSIDRSSDPWER
jgi:predicted amidophosphoribosyltransferase